MNSAFYVFIFSFLFLSAAAYYDYKWRKIPNWLNGAAAGMALVIWGAYSQWLFALQNLGIGLLLGLLFYVIGFIGAGDAKALAALSGLVGVEVALLSFIASLILLMIWVIPKRIRELGLKGFLESERQGFLFCVSQYAIKRNLRINKDCFPRELKKVPLAPFFLPGFMMTTVILVMGWWEILV